MKRDTKGQVAMEFMMTYGWAILAAMIVIAALAYFGITNPSSTLPDKCTFSNAFQCSDYMITPAQTSIRLMNTLGQTIYDANGGTITAVITDTDPDVPCTVTGSPITDLEPEAILEIICDNPEVLDLSAGDKLKRKIVVTYAKVPGGYDQISLGELYATVQ